MAEEQVSIIEAIERIAYEYAQEQGFFVANAIGPKLQPIAERLVLKLPLFGYEITEIKRPTATHGKPEPYGVEDDPNA